MNRRLAHGILFMSSFITMATIYINSKLTLRNELKPQNNVHHIGPDELFSRLRPDVNLTLFKTDILTWSLIKHDSQRDPYVNDHKFRYNINSDVCQKYSPNVIIFVQTATSHFEHREKIRTTWGSLKSVGNVTFETVFMLGSTEHSNTQEQIVHESEQSGDIVQGDFMDTYRNLSLKHIMALSWITSNCPNVDYIVKVDDDTLFNVFNFVDFIKRPIAQEKLLYCSIYYHNKPIRYEHDKWYVSNLTYPFKVYPKYCEGFGYVMSPDVAKSLCTASKNTLSYWVDDVYVTGILALKIGLELFDLPKRHTFKRSSLSSSVDIENAMFAAGRKLDKDWETLLRNHPNG